LNDKKTSRKRKNNINSYQRMNSSFRVLDGLKKDSFKLESLVILKPDKKEGGKVFTPQFSDFDLGWFCT